MGILIRRNYSASDLRRRLRYAEWEIVTIRARLAGLTPGSNEASRLGAQLELAWRVHDSLMTIQDGSAGGTASSPGNPLSQKQLVSRAPGYRLLSVAELFFPPSAVEDVLRPTVEDLNEEYATALAQGRSGKAAFVRIRGTWAFLKAAGLLKVLSLVKSAVRIWTAI